MLVFRNHVIRFYTQTDDDERRTADEGACVRADAALFTVSTAALLSPPDVPRAATAMCASSQEFI